MSEQEDSAMGKRDNRVAIMTHGRSPFGARLAMIAAMMGVSPEQFMAVKSGQPVPPSEPPRTPAPPPAPKLTPITDAGFAQLQAARIKQRARNAKRAENFARQEAGKMK